MYHISRYQYPSRANLFSSYGVPSRQNSLSGLENEIDRLFASAFSELAAPSAARSLPVDFYEDKDNHYVRAELPGVSRESITVEVVDGSLNLSASSKKAGANGEETSTRTRSISVPETVQADKVTAAYENGVLLITLPKQEEIKPRKITVAVN